MAGEVSKAKRASSRGAATAAAKTASGERPRARASMAGAGKAPRTERGERTMRRILDAARDEFGENGFADTSIVAITSRAKVALGTFYTYFDSKEALFAALVRDMSARVRDHVAPVLTDAAGVLDGERRALAAFLDFVANNRGVYRIIDEAEFVDPAAFRDHYETTVGRIAARLAGGVATGELADADPLAREVRAWALMGMNVFLGLRFGVWGREDPAEVAAHANRLFATGISAGDERS